MTYGTVHPMRSIYRDPSIYLKLKVQGHFSVIFYLSIVIRLRKGLQKCEILDSIFCLLYRVCLGQRLTFYPIQAFHVFSPSISSGFKMDGSGFKEVFVFRIVILSCIKYLLTPHNFRSLGVKKRIVKKFLEFSN